MAKCYLLTGFLVLALAFAAGADFRAVRSIPVPYGPGALYGLDSDGDTLFAVAHRGDCDGYCSYMYLLDPSDGQVHREGYYLNYQPDCSAPSLLLSGACCGGQAYWVGDECGDVVKVRWTPDSLNVLESFIISGGDVDPARPAGLAYRWPNVYMLDAAYGRIRIYDDYYDTLDGEIPLPGVILEPTSVTFYGDNYLVSSALTDTVFEVNPTGDLVGTHWLEGFGEREAVGMTFVDGELYVASPYDSILVFVFSGSSYEQPVPPGDDVAVEIVPGTVTVRFDSVSTGGTMTADRSPTDSCPPPDGVSFFDVFTEISTNAEFDWAAQVILGTAGGLPPGVDPDLVRVFVRPSGTCGSPGYRDITVDADLAAVTSRDLLSGPRTKSEDFEFSVFALAEDHRPPAVVVDLKFDRLEAGMDAGRDLIPPDVFDRITAILEEARIAYCHGLALDAAILADSIATIVRATPEIPHTYQQEVPGSNLAGRLIADAHTLAFSLRFLADETRTAACTVTPTNLILLRDGLVRACLDVPDGLSGSSLKRSCFYFEHEARAIPESVQILDCDCDGHPEILGMFRARAFKAALSHAGGDVAPITCFADGFQVRADVSVKMFTVAEGSLGEPGAKQRDVPTFLASEAATGLDDRGRVFRVSPNPSTSSFAVELARDGAVAAEIAVYSVTGEVIKVLHPRGPSADHLTLVWNAENEEGRRVAAGTYFVVLSEEGKTAIRKVVLQR
jgi:hypothetical protein